MYAVTIKLASQVLSKYNLNDTSAFNLISHFLTSQGFTEERQGYYVGSTKTNAVTTMLAIQRLQLCSILFNDIYFKPLRS